MNLKTIKQFSKENPAFPEGGMRDRIFKQKLNGLDGCFPKLGRRIYVDVAKFFAAIERLNKVAA